MRKAAISLKGNWGTQKTKYPPTSPFIAANELTAGSKNYETTLKGILTKRQGGIPYNPDDVLANPLKDQHEAIFSDGVRHLMAVQGGAIEYSTGDKTFNSVTNGTGFAAGANFEFATILDRVYGCNGVNDPIVYDKQAVYGGAPANPVPRVDDMGAQPPSSALTPAVGAGGNVPAGSYTYKVTFVYYDLSESNGGPASALVSPGVASVINLSSIPLGGHGVTARKIYRDSNDGVYRLVKIINDNTTTSDTDNEAVGTTFIPEDNNEPPVFGQIRAFLDRAWIGQIPSEPYTIRHSEVSKPDVFTDNNFIICNEGDPITSIVVYLDRLIVFNRQSMGQIVGRTSDTFRYADIQGSVGCVDNRSIQVRTLQGVPTLIWLSDKGVYGYNGNSVEYLSDDIEDLVNFNIQQAVRTKDKNTQVVNFTTIDPQRVWNDEGDWEGITPYGSLTNLASRDNGNILGAVVGQSENPATAGIRAGVIPLGVGVTLNQTSDWTGDATIGGGNFVFDTATSFKISMRFRPQRSGTITSAALFSGSFGTITIEIWSDSGGAPDVKLGNANGGGVHVNGGTAYHVVASSTQAILDRKDAVNGMQETPNFSRTSNVCLGFNGSVWVGLSSPAEASYTMSADPIAASGQWLSPLLDTKSTSAIADVVTHTSTIPANCSIVTTVEAGDGLDGGGNLIIDETHVVNNLSGSSSVPITNRRYWQVRIQLNTTDNRNVPSITSAVQLTFDLSATWVSEPVDTTHTLVNPNTSVNTVLSLDGLPITSILNGGSIVVELRSDDASDMSSPSAWIDSSLIGTVPIQRYVQIRIIFTKPSDLVTPTVSNATLNWTLQSVLEGTAIDTGIVGGPAGWDLLQADDEDNGGTVVYEVRSDSVPSSGTYFTATPEDLLPTSLPTEQYVQWRSTITSTPGNVPFVDAVVINWLVTDLPSIRVASLFFDRTYFLAAAEFDQTANNVLLTLDGEGKWRIWRDRNIATMGFFFNDPYYGDATVGTLYRLFQGYLDHGVDNIEFDVRSKAFDFSTEDADLRYQKKIVTKLKISGIGTGATITATYSVDGGKTFQPFYTDSGATSFTTTNDGEPFEVRLKAAHGDNSIYSGRTVMWKLFNNDANQVQIEAVRLEVLLRRGEVSENV